MEKEWVARSGPAADSGGWRSPKGQDPFFSMKQSNDAKMT